jgi:hypothetical protein
MACSSYSPLTTLRQVHGSLDQNAEHMAFVSLFHQSFTLDVVLLVQMLSQRFLLLNQKAGELGSFFLNFMLSQRFLLLDQKAGKLGE